MTVKEAAEALGISIEAVRKRIEREQLEHERVDGRVYVYLDLDQTKSGPHVEGEATSLISAKDETIRVLREQLEAEREARRRADTIIAQLTQANAVLASRIPELEPAREAPSEPRKSAENARETTETTPLPADAHHEEDTDRPWWRRWFS